MKRENLEGKRFERLVCVDSYSQVLPNGKKGVFWNCLCDCGNKVAVKIVNLKMNRTVSCGCWIKPKEVKIQPCIFQKYIGDVFGRWTVEDVTTREYEDGRKRKFFKSKCSCGTTKQVDVESVLKSTSLSCGCLRKELMTTHGLSYEREIGIYYGVLGRCYNNKREDYKRYGARGIGVTEAWKGEGGLVQFVEDMGPCPSDKHTIERKDSNADYSPENCIWTDDLGLQAYNQNQRTDNTSGRTGVHLSKGSWIASIGWKGQTVHLGCFSSFESACAVREQAEIKYYGFSKE